jgi:hypothetical protein
MTQKDKTPETSQIKATQWETLQDPIGHYWEANKELVFGDQPFLMWKGDAPNSLNFKEERTHGI